MLFGEGQDLWNGVLSTFDEFIAFDYWKYNHEIYTINSDYKKFKNIKLEI